MNDMETQHIADMPTLEYPILSADDTVKTPGTPIPSMPSEVAAGPGWQLFKYDQTYALVLYALNGTIEIPLESAHLKFLGFDIHTRYRKLEER